MYLNNRGSFNYKGGITLTPYKHFAITDLWRVCIYKPRVMHTGEDGSYTPEESVAVFAVTPHEAVKEGIKAYLRNKPPRRKEADGFSTVH